MNENTLEKLMVAEDILLDVFQEIREKRGYAKEAKRLDSILGKLNQLQELIREK